MRVTIRGIQEAQQANQRMIAALQPNGAFGRLIQHATIEAHRYAVSITHVDTGALKASHRMDVNSLRGLIYIDPASVSPRGGRPAVYGLAEHNRGGGHAFYERTVNEAGDRIVRAGAEGFFRELR